MHCTGVWHEEKINNIFALNFARFELMFIINLMAGWLVGATSIKY